METTRQRMVRMYAYAIYIDGTRTFASVNTSYHLEIKQYAASNFSLQQIDNAMALNYITEQAYLDTLALVPAA